MQGTCRFSPCSLLQTASGCVNSCVNAQKSYLLVLLELNAAMHVFLTFG